MTAMAWAKVPEGIRRPRVLRDGARSNNQDSARCIVHRPGTACHAGATSFAELEASILGWTNHVAHADSWGLKHQMLDGLAIRPAEHRRAVAGRRRKNREGAASAAPSSDQWLKMGTNTQHENRR